MSQVHYQQAVPLRQPPVRAAPIPGPYEISVLATADEIQRISGCCASLLTSPLEPNVFYEPWMLAAALTTLPSSSVRIVVVSERSTGTVTGLFPFQLANRFHGLPTRVLRSWQHSYCFLCTPLIAAAQARETLRCVVDWLESEAAPADLIELELCSADGPFDALLQAELARRPRWRSLSQQYERAILQPPQSRATGISGRHLKELRRRARRLAETGACVYRVLASGEDVAPWLKRFLDLEASGWKGRVRTALASNEASRRFFERAATEAAGRDRLHMLSLELNGAPVAMMCSFLAGEGAFGFKMAYDERYAKYSPGVLLQLFHMQNIGRHCPQTQWIDSCTATQHPLMNRLWPQRRRLGDRRMTSRRIPAVLLSNWPHLARLRRLLTRRGRPNCVP